MRPHDDAGTDIAMPRRPGDPGSTSVRSRRAHPGWSRAPRRGPWNDGHVTDGDVFAERLLQVIDEGQRTATYKLALILALIDASAEHAGTDGRAPDVLHTRDIARHVLRLYLPQARLYLAGDGEAMQLRQITNKQSAILGAVLRLHLAADAAHCRSFADIATRIPDELDTCLDAVEATVARYPLRLLQVVGREHRPFLYDIDWGESVALRTLHALGGGQVRLRPGAGDHLLRLAPLVRPLVELHWTRMVARLNGLAVEEQRLHQHLFGVERAAFPAALRAGLVDLHGSTCFYCGEPLRGRVELDHFIPWSRWPNDAVENLVPADRCNNRKRDYLPALAHVERWADRLANHGRDLATIGSSTPWETEPARSMALVRSCYAHLPSGTPLWLSDDQFTDDDPTRVVDLLS
jgi:5-methylcytosine-specific restriction endonuclease McrA